MKQKGYKFSAVFFFLLLIADVIAVAASFQEVHFLVKPLLMPVLAVLVYLKLSGIPSKRWYFTFAGLILAWAGDVFLLFEYQNASFFLFGLASFLGTHICYIMLFKYLITPQSGWWVKKSWLWLSVAAYGILLVALLWQNLGGMKIPVMVYAACISCMVMFSLRLQPNLPKNIWIYFSTGAFLFFISDSILALNKFYQPADMAPPAIMLTYGLAQFFIARGTVLYFGSATRGEG